MDNTQVLTVKDLMETLRMEESINERRENPIRWIIMAWEVDHNLYLSDYDDNGTMKLILTPNSRNALKTIYPRAVFAKMLQQTRLHRNYGQWVVWNYAGDRYTCWVSEEGIKEWEDLMKKKRGSLNGN